jgi:pimeloyl-ACP methyl ester carboxylesterase
MPGPVHAAGHNATSSRGHSQARRPRSSSTTHRVRQSKQALAQLRPFSAPALVIWGQRDRYLGPKLAELDREDVPNLDRVERLPDVSHWVHHDAPERVAQLLIDSLPRPA